MTITFNLSRTDILNINKGTFTVFNTSNIIQTNWKIILKLRNFKITQMSNLNFDCVDDIYTFTPKQWKINVEPLIKLESNFIFIPSNNFEHFEYEMVDIKSQNLFQDEGIHITIDNNTENDFIIKSGENYTFKISG